MRRIGMGMAVALLLALGAPQARAEGDLQDHETLVGPVTAVDVENGRFSIDDDIFWVEDEGGPSLSGMSTGMIVQVEFERRGERNVARLIQVVGK